MAKICHWVRRITRAASPPRNIPNSRFKVISNIKKLEEENWDWYTPDLFYPVRIGEVFNSRYQVLGKLGYGTRSTAWLCRDLRLVRQRCVVFVLLRVKQRTKIRYIKSMRDDLPFRSPRACGLQPSRHGYDKQSRGITDSGPP